MKLLQTIKLDDFTLDVDLTIPSDKVTVIFGESGSGKSTLLRCIAGLERARGKITVNDTCWQDDHGGVFLSTQKRNIGYVFQEPQLFPHLSVQDNILIGLKSTTVDHSLLSLLKLQTLLNRKVNQLSGGEKQRVSIARALIRKPSILMFDEPLAGIDNAHRQKMLPYIQSVSRNLRIPCIYVTHHIDEVLALADYLVLMEQGRVTHHQDFPTFALNSELAVEMGLSGSCLRLNGNLKINDGNYFIPATQALITQSNAEVYGKVVLDGQIKRVNQLKGIKDFLASTNYGDVRIQINSDQPDNSLNKANDCCVVLNHLIRR